MQIITTLNPLNISTEETANIIFNETLPLEKNSLTSALPTISISSAPGESVTDTPEPVKETTASTTVTDSVTKFIAKATKTTLYNAIKKLKFRQRKKLQNESETNKSSVYATSALPGLNPANFTPTTEILHSIEDEISERMSNKYSIEISKQDNSNEKYADKISHFKASQRIFPQDRRTESSTVPSSNSKTDIEDQRTTKSLDLNNLRPKPSRTDDPQDQKILRFPSATNDKVDQDRIIVWDELKDCIQPFGSAHDQPVKEDIHSLNPASRNEFDQFESREFNKRVLSAPSFNIGTVTVRAEEIGLVLVILLLWAGAISLFINRWGKLRMLEPYQPQYTAPEPTPAQRAPVPPPPFININIQSTSSLSLNENYRRSSPIGGGFAEWEASDHLSPRRSICGLQSTGMGVDRSSSSLMMTPLSSQRRVRSAVDLVSLVMQEKIHTGNQFAATNV